MARLAGVSVRTLHHYDRIGLVRPGVRSAAGYRRYGDDDLGRLQQVLFYRELGFGLPEIAAALSGQGDALAHLRRQHELLRDRIARLTTLSTAVEAAMEALRMNINLTPEERLKVFGSFQPEEHSEEAASRWGGSTEFEESARRTARYGKGDWERVKAEGQAAVDALAAAWRAGAAPTSAAAMEAAEAHRRHIDAAFYPCPPALHRQLAAGYLADERFTATFEAIEPGLTQFVHDAINANADRQGA